MSSPWAQGLVGCLHREVFPSFWFSFMVFHVALAFLFLTLTAPFIDFSWKVAHGVLHTAKHLSPFRYDIPLSCFCSTPCESLQHPFLDCPLAVSLLHWLLSLLF